MTYIKEVFGFEEGGRVLRYAFQWPAMRPGASSAVYDKDHEVIGLLVRHNSVNPRATWMFSFTAGDEQSTLNSDPVVSIDELLYPTP